MSTKQHSVTDPYEESNTEFIILHAGLSKYRTLRVVLIQDTKAPTAFLYNVIIYKKMKRIPKNVNEENLKTLTMEEKAELDQELQTRIEFLNNPQFYTELNDLFHDLNAKQYIPKNWNTALLSNGKNVTSFEEIDDKVTELYLAEVNENSGHAKVVKSIKKIEKHKEAPRVYYSLYTNLLDLPIAKLGNANVSGEIYKDPYVQKVIKAGLLGKEKKRQIMGEVWKYNKHKNHISLQRNSKEEECLVLPDIVVKSKVQVEGKRKVHWKISKPKVYPKPLGLFKLDSEKAETIKQNYRSYVSLPKKEYIQKVEIKPKEKPKEMMESSNKDLIIRYKDNEYIKALISKYRYTLEKMDKIVQQFFTLYTAHTTEGFNAFLSDNALCTGARINVLLLKDYFPRLRMMQVVVYKRILLSLDIINEATLDDFCRVRYYLIDSAALTTEYIRFCLNFFNPGAKQVITGEKLCILLKTTIVKDDTAIKSNMLLKTLIKSYIIHGVIDDKGVFNPKAFEEVYRKGTMSIFSLVKAILN